MIDSLKTKALQGISWTALSSAVVGIVQFAQVAILAHFLSAEDFGLFAIIMVVVGFSQMFSDLGIGKAIIQEKFLTINQLSTLYWVNVMTGVVLFFLIYFFSPIIAQFYEEPVLHEYLVVMGFSFLIQPFGQQFMILMEKELLFDRIAKIEIMSKVLTLIVSVFLAFKGFNIYSIIVGFLAGIIFKTLWFVFVGLKRYSLRFVLRISEVKNLLSFGLYFVGSQTVNFFNSQMDIIIIGKLLGSESLGLYSIAKQIILKPAQLINPIVLKVLYPFMAKIKDDTNKLKDIYLKILRNLSSINFPIYMFIFLFAHEIVSLFFGLKWLDIVPLIRILAFYGAFRSVANPQGALLLSKGKANWTFWWNISLLVIFPLIIVLSSYFGLEGISLTISLAMFIILFFSWYFLISRLINCSLIEFASQFIIPFLISVFSAFITYLVTLVIFDSLLKIIISLVLSLSLIIVLNYLYNRVVVNQFLILVKSKKNVSMNKCK